MEDISRINNKVWGIGEQRAKIIAPLAKSNICSRRMVVEAADKLELSTRYVYKLIQNYRQSQGLITSIIPQKPNGGKGRSRLLKQQEDIVNEVIDRFYLTSQKLSAAKIIEEIQKQCFEKQISSPSEITIRRRLRSISLVLKYCIDKQNLTTNECKNIVAISGIKIIAFDETQALIAANIYPKTKEFGLSLGDRACIALAIDKNYRILTCDKIWEKVDLGVKFIMVR